MKRDHALTTLRAHRDELTKLGVGELYLFGSVARDEARDDSDVDLFFDYNYPRFSLLDLVGVKDRVSEILGTDADVMTRRGLHRDLRADIEAEAIRVF
jgi:uncharacterized protein